MPAFESASDLAGMFDVADFGDAATYLPETGPAVSLNVIVSHRQPDAFGSPGGAALATSTEAVVQASALGVTPERGDRIVISGTFYTVEAVTRDVTGATWTLSLSTREE